MCVLVVYYKDGFVYACGVMFGLEGLSQIRVWDVLDGWTHDGHGTG